MLLERAAAGIGLLVAAPVVLPIMAAVRAMSGRAPLVGHTRAGYRGEKIQVLKIRTMWERSPHSSGGETPRGATWAGGWIEQLDQPPVPASKLAQDARVTSRFAAFLRRHSIDELPQLWHVVTGQMQLVGPRPITYGEVAEHYRSDATELLSVRPGLTGLWQVMGRDRLTYPQRRRLDLFWVRRGTRRLYLRILLRTVGEVFAPR